METKLDDQAGLQVLASEFGVDTTPAAQLKGLALRAWIAEAEDSIARLMLKMSYMPNSTPAEKAAARARLEDLRERATNDSLPG